MSSHRLVVQAVLRTWLITAAIIGCLANASSTEQWPKVKPVTKTVYFKNGENAALTLFIYGSDGKRLYRMNCHSLGYVDPDFDYSGDFECRLMPLYTQTAYSTLFTYDPNQSGDWESRARFFAADVTGKCANYPEFGSMRHFYLRGMEITLGMSDIRLREFARGEPAQPHTRSLFASFKFHVSVRRDPKATSQIDVPVKQNPKYGSCNEDFVQIK